MKGAIIRSDVIVLAYMVIKSAEFRFDWRIIKVYAILRELIGFAQRDGPAL